MNPPEKIVEIYGRSCLNPDEAQASHLARSEVGVQGKKFSRTIFRPQYGPDLLVNQYVQNGRTFYYNLRLPVIRSNGAFREFIFNSELAQQELNRVTPQRLVHSSLEDEWSWGRVTSSIYRYVTNSIDLSALTATDRFACYCDEAFGDLYIMNERDYIEGPEVPMFAPMGVNDDCPLCPREYYFTYAPMLGHGNDPYEDYLRFFCCSRLYHRRCVLPWLWIETDEHFSTSSLCPVCMH